jgi:hypothetical protein
MIEVDFQDSFLLNQKANEHNYIVFCYFLF